MTSNNAVPLVINQNTMTDIQTQEDLYLIVSEFYKKLFADDVYTIYSTKVVAVDQKLEERLQVSGSVLVTIVI